MAMTDELRGQQESVQSLQTQEIIIPHTVCFLICLLLLPFVLSFSFSLSHTLPHPQTWSGCSFPESQSRHSPICNVSVHDLCVRYGTDSTWVWGLLMPDARVHTLIVTAQHTVRSHHDLHHISTAPPPQDRQLVWIHISYGPFFLRFHYIRRTLAICSSYYPIIRCRFSWPVFSSGSRTQYTHSTKNQKLYQSQRHIIIILCCCSRVREWKLHPFYEIILHMPLSFAVFGLPACVRAQCSCGPLFKFSVPFSQRIWHMNCVHNSRRLPEWRQTKIVKLLGEFTLALARACFTYTADIHTYIAPTAAEATRSFFCCCCSWSDDGCCSCCPCN